MKRVNNNIYKILSIILIVVISIVNVPNALAAESIINDIVNITAKEETLYEKYQLSDLPSVVSSSVYSTEKTPVKIINQSVDDEYTITVKNDDGTNMNIPHVVEHLDRTN